MKKIIFLSLAAFLFIACGCTKDKLDELPPATQTGANTFGCKINGVVYRCSGYWSPNMIMMSEGLEVKYENGVMNIVAHFVKPEERIFNLYFAYDGGVGEYRNIKWVVPGSNSYISINKFENGIMSGTFNIVINASEDNNSEDTNYYTDGRFDIQTNTNINSN